LHHRETRTPRIAIGRGGRQVAVPRHAATAPEYVRTANINQLYIAS